MAEPEYPRFFRARSTLRLYTDAGAYRDPGPGAYPYRRRGGPKGFRSPAARRL